MAMAPYFVLNIGQRSCFGWFEDGSNQLNLQIPYYCCQESIYRQLPIPNKLSVFCPTSFLCLLHFCLFLKKKLTLPEAK